jgi:hypothetical protein
LPQNPVMLTQGELKTMTKGFTWMLAEAVVSFVDPARSEPETGERVEFRVGERRLRSGESTD